MSDGDATATLLGFDFGRRRIGVAVGQTLTGNARPLTTVETRDGQPPWERLDALLREWSPQALVIGLPLDRSGGEQGITLLIACCGTRRCAPARSCSSPPT